MPDAKQIYDEAYRHAMNVAIGIAAANFDFKTAREIEKVRDSRQEPEFPSAIGTSAALKLIASRHGWNQSQAAKRLGLHRSHYSEILAGKRKLPFASAKKAYALGLPAQVLLRTAKNDRRKFAE